jgi:ELWxxDGT repeat protein
VEYNGHLYFAADSNDGFGVEVHRYDPSTHSVVRVSDINNGAGDSNPAWFTVYNGKLYFAADDGTNGVELWSYDGINTSLVDDINSGISDSNPSWLTVYNNVLYFAADDGTNGVELWSYNGTSVSMVSDINNGASSSNPEWLTVYNNILYFAADDGTNGVELWSYDGSSTSLVDDINGAGDSNPNWLTVYNNILYFAADDGTNGVELWSYDGSSTSLVDDINGAGDSNPNWLTVYNGVLYFAADDGIDGVELWSYDGTSVSLVSDINNGAGSSNPEWLTVYNGVLYFAADNGTDGVELWSYDSGTSNTSLIGDINIAGDSNPSWLTVFNNSLFFNADNGSIGAELWILYDQQPHSITISGGGQSTTVNTAFGSPVVVTVLDQYGNAVGSGYAVTFSPPGSAASASFGGGTFTTDASGQVSVTPTANTVVGSYFVGVAVSGGSNPTGSFTLTNTPDVPHSITISGGDQSTVVNTAFGSPIVVSVFDQYGNAVGSGYTVTFSPPASGASAVFSGGPFVTDASGQVSVTPTANTVAGSYSVTVSVSGGSNPTDSLTLTNTADAPHTVNVSGGNQSTTVNTAFSNQIVVTVLDQHGNPVPNVPVAFFLPTGGASGTLSGGPVGFTDANGQVVKTLTANTVAGTFSINVQVIGGTHPNAVISNLTNVPGPVAQIAFLPLANRVTVNTPITPPVRVVLLDQYGNRLYQAGVQVRLSLRRANKTHSPNLLGGPITVVTNANGVASFAGVTITSAGRYKFLARVLNITGIPVILSARFNAI